MILDFSISNFGPIRDKLTLSFEATLDKTLEDYYVTKKEDGQRILKMGIIYGPNASGKTTVLQALDLLRELIISPLEKKSEKFSLNKFRLDKKSEDNPTTFELRFYVGDIKYKYELSVTYDSVINEKLTYYPKLRPAVVYERVQDGGVSKIEFGSTVESSRKDEIVLEGNTLQNNTVLGAYSKTNILIEPIESAFDWFNKRLNPIISTRHSLLRFTNDKIDEGVIDKSQIVELLSNADLNIIDLEIVDEEVEVDEQFKKIVEVLSISDDTKEELMNNAIINKNVVFRHATKNKGQEIFTMDLDDSFESSGTIRYYGLTGAILASAIDERTLLIDELDHSLHPDLMKHILLNFITSAGNSQLLFTTHNSSFLKEREILRNDIIWFTEKNEDGSSDLFSLSDFKSDEFRKEGSIYNAYTLGKLGGKPNVTGSFFKKNKGNG